MGSVMQEQMRKPFGPVMIGIVSFLLAGGLAEAGLLFKDGDKVVMVVTKGPDVERMGSQGKGRFLMTYRAVSKRFGHGWVLRHEAGSLTYKGPRGDTCVLTADRKFGCKKFGSGRWELKN
jgi:hypothetical protein